jgi:hypothetical protein
VSENVDGQLRTEPKAGFTYESWADLFGESRRDDWGQAQESEWMTTKALIKLTGWSVERLHEFLERYDAVGLLDVKRIDVRRIDGAWTKVPTYRIRKPTSE